MQAVSEQVEIQERVILLSSTHEDERKLQMIFATIHYAGLRGCDLSTLVPQVLSCWTVVVDGRLVPTF